MKNIAKGAILVTAMCYIMLSSAVFAADGFAVRGTKGTKNMPAEESAAYTNESRVELTEGSYATFDDPAPERKDIKNTREEKASTPAEEATTADETESPAVDFAEQFQALDEKMEEALEAAKAINPVMEEFIEAVTEEFELHSEEKPAAENPAEDEPAEDESFADELIVDEPITDEPEADDTDIDKPAFCPKNPYYNVPAPRPYPYPGVYIQDHLLAGYDIVTEYDDTNGVYAGVINGRIRSGAQDTAMEAKVRENWEDYIDFLPKIRSSKVFDLVSVNCENALIFRENTKEVVCKGKDIEVNTDFWGNDFGTFGDMWLTVRGVSYHINAIRSPKAIFEYTKYIYTHPDEDFIILYAVSSRGTLARNDGIRGNVSGFVDAELLSKIPFASLETN